MQPNLPVHADAVGQRSAGLAAADGRKLVYADSRLGPGASVRVLDTSSPAGSAASTSTVIYTYPAGVRALSVTLDTDSTTVYVMWLTGPDGYHLTRTLAGYRIGPRGMQGTLFRRTVPAGMFVSRAGRELLVWDPGVTSTWSTP